MKQMHYPIWCLMALCLTIATFSSCKKEVELKSPNGTIEEPLAEDTLPDHVKKAMANALKYHEFELFSDTANNVSVSGIGEAGQQSTEGFGIVVVKNAVSTTFPNIRNTRQPKAFYDKANDELWLSTSAMEGTNIQVERLYKFRFTQDSAAIVTTIDPYDVQSSFCHLLQYTTEGEDITLYIDRQPVTTVTNTVTDMGGFDDNAIWIGENITYDFSNGQPRVCVIPGVKFVTGLVLHYEDMPTLTGTIEKDDSGTLSVSDIKVENPSNPQ